MTSTHASLPGLRSHADREEYMPHHTLYLKEGLSVLYLRRSAVSSGTRPTVTACGLTPYLSAHTCACVLFNFSLVLPFHGCVYACAHILFLALPSLPTLVLVASFVLPSLFVGTKGHTRVKKDGEGSNARGLGERENMYKYL